MAKYRFPLETLAKVRSHRRDERRQRLADAYRADAVLAEQRRQIDAQLAELQEIRRTATAAKYVDVNCLAAAGRYEPLLQSHRQTIEEQQRLLDEEIERRRVDLVEADREVRVLERLDERYRTEHRELAQRTENKQLDDVACQTWLRQQKRAGESFA